MTMRFAGALSLALLLASRLSAADPTTSRAARQANESIPITVDSLNAPCRFVVVCQHVDLSRLLLSRGITGAVDTHSIELFLVNSDGREQPEPAQWTSDVQDRSKKRQLLPATTHAVSYGAEQQAGTASAHASGTLTWIIHSGQGPTRHYLLKYCIPKHGRFIQAPYSPNDWHAFDDRSHATTRQFPIMQIHPQWPVDGLLELFQGKTRMLGYHIGPTTYPAAGAIRRPFIYPVIGPDDIPLTEFGKPHDPTGSHAHHYSLWIAHANVDGHDFWSEKGGAIVHTRLEDQEDGPVFCRIVQSTQWMWDKTDLLHERRTVTLYNTPDDFRIVDIDLDLTPAGKEPVTFGQSTFGFLATRVRQSMTVFDGGGEILNSQGDLNEQNAHLKHANWIDLSGPIAPDKWGGIAILDHPANLNHPSMFHCRNDGWACASFTGDAPYVLEPGKTLHLRYRVLLHRGNAKEGNVAQHFVDYSVLPEVKLPGGSIKQ